MVAVGSLIAKAQGVDVALTTRYESIKDDYIARLQNLNSLSVVIAATKFKEIALAQQYSWTERKGRLENAYENLNTDLIKSYMNGSISFLETTISLEDVNRITSNGLYARDIEIETAELISEYFELKEKSAREMPGGNSTGLSRDEFMFDFYSALDGYILNRYCRSDTTELNVMASALVAESLSIIEMGQKGIWEPDIPAIHIFLHDQNEDKAAAFAVAISYLQKWVRSTAEYEVGRISDSE
jgi:hypothetical protein